MKKKKLRNYKVHYTALADVVIRVKASSFKDALHEAIVMGKGTQVHCCPFDVAESFDFSIENEHSGEFKNFANEPEEDPLDQELIDDELIDNE